MRSTIRRAMAARPGRRGRPRPAAERPSEPVAPPPADTSTVGFDGDRIVVRGSTTDGAAVDAVVFRLRETEQEWRVETGGGADFEATSPVPEPWPTTPFTIDLHLDVRDGDGVASRRRLAAEPGHRSVVTSTTHEWSGRPAWGYATRGSLTSVRVGVVRQPKLALALKTLQASAHGVRFEARVETIHVDPADVRLEVSVRGTDHAVRLPVDVGPTRRNPVYQELVYDVTGEFDVRDLLANGLPEVEQTLDVRLVATATDGSELRRGLSVSDETTGFDRMLPLTAPVGGDRHVFVPTVTFKSQNLCFDREIFAEEDYLYLQRLRRLGPLWIPIRWFSRAWMIGETPYKAQDSGFHLFAWIRRHHPRRSVHYVIDRDSPERAAVEQCGHAVLMRSRQHIALSFRARRIATSHKAEFVLASTDPRATRWMRGTRVFLQHGVLGAKNMVETYGRVSPAFRTDYFHVSSERERELMINDLRYRPQQVRVTGLSRFDRLLTPVDTAPEGVLVIPTWRDWLGRPGAFEESEFLERWRAFLTGGPLQEAIAAGLPVTVILHPNMRYFDEALRVDGVRVVRQGEQDVQTLMRTHAAMVTDYSSVGFDFSFQGRPVFYYQFDRARFLGPRPSHLDLDLDLPGEVHTDREALTEALLRSWHEGFVQAPEYARRSRVFLAPARDSYCQQVYDSVRTARSPWVPLWRLRDSALGRRTYARFRDGRWFEPTIAAMSWVGRVLPRRNLAVFESDVGREVADSPRAIYEELVRRQSTVETMWSTRSTFRPADVRTRKVEPGGPAFFWRMSRARYWVNNQNFGPFVTRPRGTTYLQTWHGTPLKRMQFDAVDTQGRAPGYLDRVSRKTATWSILLSPSSYATEAFRSAFRYAGRVLEVGYPRNDVLVLDAVERGGLARRRVGVSDDVTVVLYAPTFRDDVKQGKRFAWDDVVDWAALAEAVGPETVVLVRRHGVVRGSLRIPTDLADRVIDVSGYPDMQDLLCATDVLVTDYSSVMFDFAILDRPMVFYCYDLEHYRDDLRGFYLDLESGAPGPIVRTQQELHRALLADDEFADRRREFRARFAPRDDGHAAARVVDEVFGTP